MKNIKKIGRRKSEVSARSRPVEMQLAFRYDHRINLNNIYLLNKPKFFLNINADRKNYSLLLLNWNVLRVLNLEQIENL